MAEKKRKIIYLVTQSEWGGAQEYVYNLATNLDKNRFEVLVLAGQSISSESRGEGDDWLFKKLTSAGIPYLKLKHLKRAVSPLSDFLALKEIISIYKKEKPNVIHLNSSKAGFLGALAGKIYKGISPLPRLIGGFGRNDKAKIIYTAHGWVFNEPLNFLKKKLYFWIEKISAGWKDKIICVSEADKQIAVKNNFKSNLITIHNAVDPDNLNFLTKEDAQQKIINLFQNLELKINSKFKIQNSKLIAAIANLYPTKGLNFLIDAAAKLIKDDPDLLFVIFGDGVERKKLELKINDLGLNDKVILAGRLTDAHQYLKAFDLFVLPSVKEGLPYAILKAIAAQIPVVATQTGGLPEILPAGCLVPARDADQLSDRIQKGLAGQLPWPQNQTGSFREFLEKTTSLY